MHTPLSQELPQELLYHITCFLTHKELEVLSSLNKQFKSRIQKDSFIWKTRFYELLEDNKDNKDIVDVFEGINDWRDIFITYYKAEKKCKTPFLIGISCDGDLPAVKIMTKRFSFPMDYFSNYALSTGFASKNGHFEVVKFLLKNAPSPIHDRAFIGAAKGGHVNIIKYIYSLGKVNPAANNNEAIYNAAFGGHRVIVKLLLQDPRVDPSSGDNRTIDIAASSNHVETVMLLLQDPRVDPLGGSKNMVFRLMTTRGYRDVVQMILRHPKAFPLNWSATKYPLNDPIWVLRDVLRNGHEDVAEVLLQDSRISRYIEFDLERILQPATEFDCKRIQQLVREKIHQRDIEFDCK